MEIKTVISIIAILLLFIGYVPYIKDTIAGSTRPHIFSFILWSLTTFIIFALQLKSGAGVGAWVTFAIGLMMLFVLVLSFKNGKKDITFIDWVFLLIALAAIPIWLLAKQPIISIILLVLIDVLAFVPAMRKSWVDPWSETLILHALNVLRYVLATVALVELNFITGLSPIVSLIANIIFTGLLITRRKYLQNMMLNSPLKQLT